PMSPRATRTRPFESSAPPLSRSSASTFGRTMYAWRRSTPLRSASQTVYFIARRCSTRARPRRKSTRAHCSLESGPKASSRFCRHLDLPDHVELRARDAKARRRIGHPAGGIAHDDLDLAIFALEIDRALRFEAHGEL